MSLISGHPAPAYIYIMGRRRRTPLWLFIASVFSKFDYWVLYMDKIPNITNTLYSSCGLSVFAEGEPESEGWYNVFVSLTGATYVPYLKTLFSPL